MESPVNSGRPVLSVENISKSYGSVKALDRVSTEFFAGEIHAVLGENGAGKSTLMGVLAGFTTPDFGTVTLRGEAAPVGQPFRMKGLGIEMVHQHFMLVPAFTVAENLALANLGGLGGGLSVSEAAEPGLARAKDLGWEVDPEARVGTLPVGIQQRVEILKALAGRADVLILDEPTGVLSPDEVEGLFGVLRNLKAEGKAVILIAHKLDEVMAVADRATVLRKGKRVAQCLVAETSAAQLAEWMVGDVPVSGTVSEGETGEALLEVSNLVVLGDRGEKAVDGISLTVRAGEVLGLGGVDGNGQVELAEAVAGVREVLSGVVRAEGVPGYIPQDRQQHGLAMGLSISDNMLLAGLDRKELGWGPFLKPKAVKAWTDRLVEEYEIKVGSTNDPVRSLSGGNQQKVVVSRVLSGKPQVVVAVNPTRGLDLKATAYVHQALRDAATGGAAVLLISTDLDELATVAGRTQFLSRGRLVDSIVGATG